MDGMSLSTRQESYLKDLSSRKDEKEGIGSNYKRWRLAFDIG